MKRAPFIVLEGVEGAGKSTQVARLAAWLEETGVAFTTAREPGGTRAGEQIREILLDRDGAEISPETELFLMLAARATFVREVVQPALDRGELVLADRFDLSTYAYQGYGRGLDLDAVRRMNDFATGGLAPDLYLVFDIPVPDGLARQEAGGKEGDRFEKSGLPFLERVRAGYRELAEGDERIRLVDASGSPEAVEERVRDVLTERFPGTFSSGTV